MTEHSLSQTFDSQGITTIKAETLLGSLKVYGHAQDEIRVAVYGRFLGWNFWASEARVYEELEKYDCTIEVQNDTLIVEATLKKGVLNWLNLFSVSFKIYVPQHQYITTHLATKGGKIKLKDLEGSHFFDTKGGKIDLKNIRGEIKGKTSMGTIDAENCRAKMHISTAAGTIEIANSEGDMTFSTAAGTIELDNLMGKIDATTSAGTIETNNITGSLTVSTSAGTIDIKGMNGSVSGFTGAGSIDAEVVKLGDFLDFTSEAGSISLRMPYTEGVNIDIEGRVRGTAFPNFEGISERNRVVGTANGGGKTVRLHARYGGVYVNAPKGSFQAFTKTLKDPQFTLPSNFFNRNITGILLSLAICTIMTYGFSSITYFTVELLNANNPLGAVYKGVFITNIVNGFTAMLVTFLFTQYFADKIQKNCNKYAVLSGSMLLATVIAQTFVAVLYWQFVPNLEADKSVVRSGASFFYMVIPSIVACIYFFFWQRSRQITRKISEQEFELINLEKLKTKAELDALQARINPHFLHNSLNSIAGLVHHDPDKAEQMTLLLSKLFRYTTGTKDQHFNSIQEELEIVKTYLAIEKVRFEDRLTYSVELENGLENKEIPRFLLQPIVENAIKHGISKVSTQGKIHVRITQEGDFLRLAVHDNGLPFPDNFFTGYGLQSIQDKLKLLYGAKAQLDIQNTDYKQVIIKLPC